MTKNPLEDVVDSSAVDIYSHLGRTGYFIEWILLKLYENNEELKNKTADAKIKDVKFKCVSGGVGLRSQVYQVKLIFDNEDIFKFVVKAPAEEHVYPAGAKTKEDSQVEHAHSAEVKICNMIKDLDILVPKYFYAEDKNEEGPGLILMQDFVDESGTVGWLGSSTVEQCKNLCKPLAEFHCEMMHIPGLPWKGQFEDHMHIQGIYQSVIAELLPKSTGLVPEIKLFVEEYPFILTPAFSKFCIQEKAAEYNATFFLHSDLHGGNMLFKKRDDGSVSNVPLAMIDWQTAMEGNPLYDIAHFVCPTADADVRREVDSVIPDLYYDALVEAYRKHEDVVPFTRDQARELYDLAIMQQTFQSLCMPAMLSSRGSGPVHEAKTAKVILKTKFLIDDTRKILKKYGLQNWRSRGGRKHSITKYFGLIN
uniref:CHK domain-containing protein n=2 Tax=Bursaphelenchus xylophilus TaxID=6326 RepID=A0A1I7S087_BURXY